MDRDTHTEHDAGLYERSRSEGGKYEDAPDPRTLAEDAADCRRIAVARGARSAEAARRAAEDRQQQRRAAGLIDWTLGREGDDRFTESMTCEELAALGTCPACGQPMTDCPGHSQYGDPTGWRIVQAHTRGEHTLCVPGGCA